MTATLFTLKPQARGLHIHAIRPTEDDGPRIIEQSETAYRLLRALNREVCGDPDGPFRQLVVFNAQALT